MTTILSPEEAIAQGFKSITTPINPVQEKAIFESIHRSLQGITFVLIQFSALHFEFARLDIEVLRWNPTRENYSAY